jgi:hypothetical protein
MLCSIGIKRGNLSSKKKNLLEATFFHQTLLGLEVFSEYSKKNWKIKITIVHFIAVVYPWNEVQFNFLCMHGWLVAIQITWMLDAADSRWSFMYNAVVHWLGKARHIFYYLYFAITKNSNVNCTAWSICFRNSPRSGEWAMQMCITVTEFWIQERVIWCIYLHSIMQLCRETFSM